MTRKFYQNDRNGRKWSVLNGGVVGVKLPGGWGAALLMVPPASHIFCLLVWDACHVVGTTCNDRWSLRNTFGCMWALQAPQQFNGKVLVEVQGARYLEAPKNLHFMVSKSRSIAAQEYVDGYAFFMYIVVPSHRKIPKVQNFQFSSFLSEKKVCVFYSSSWTIFLKFKRQAI